MGKSTNYWRCEWLFPPRRGDLHRPVVASTTSTSPVEAVHRGVEASTGFPPKNFTVPIGLQSTSGGLLRHHAYNGIKTQVLFRIM